MHRPADGDVAAREHLRHVEVGDERQLHAAPHLGLQVAQEPGAVERVHHRRREPARNSSHFGGLLAQERNQLARAAHGFVVADVGETGGFMRGVHNVNGAPLGAALFG